MKRLIGGFLVCFAAASSACGAQTRDPQIPQDNFISKLRTATEEAGLGDISSALADTKAALVLGPNRPDGWYVLGSMLGQTGDFQGAEAAFRRAIQLKPDLAKAHFSLALTLIGNPQGKMDWAGAIFECREALKYQPDYPQALNLLGAGLAATGEPDAAIPVLQQAIQLSPKLAEAHFNLGMALEGNNRLDEASKEYEAAVAARGRYPEATSALGSLHFRMGKSADAERELNEALRLNPDLTSAHYSLARLLRSLNRKSEAAIEFAETKDLTDRPANGIQSSQMSNHGLGLASHGDLPGAEAQLRRAITLKPDYGVPHFNLGLILADSGETKGALEELVKGISLLPGQAKPWLQYGRVLQRAKDYHGALEAIAWASRLSPADAGIHTELASLQGNASLSEAAARQPSVGAASDSATDHQAFALQLHTQGDFQGEVGELLRAIALQPAAVELRRRLADAYIRIGENEHALLEYSKVLRSLPDDVETRIAVGRIQLAQGDADAARQQFRMALNLRPDSAEARTALEQAEKTTR